MPDEKFYEDMFCNYETTYRTEYRDGEIKPIIKTVYEPKPPCYYIRPPPLKDTHTLVDWKDARVPPFNLFHKPKDIVRTSPWDGQEPYDKPKDTDLEEAVKTRPRLVMTPSVSLDDVPPDKRKCLIEQMYVTTTQRAARSAMENFKPSTRAPLPALPGPANPLALQKLLPPYVSPEWRLSSVAWDGAQLRGYCHPDRQFYCARTPHCAACEFTAARTAKMKSEERMKMKNH